MAFQLSLDKVGSAEDKDAKPLSDGDLIGKRFPLHQVGHGWWASAGRPQAAYPDMEPAWSGRS